MMGDTWNEKGNALKALGRYDEANELFKIAESRGNVFSIGDDYLED
jgi:hypothetical protein